MIIMIIMIIMTIIIIYAIIINYIHMPLSLSLHFMRNPYDGVLFWQWHVAMGQHLGFAWIYFPHVTGKRTNIIYTYLYCFHQCASALIHILVYHDLINIHHQTSSKPVQIWKIHHEIIFWPTHEFS